MALKLYMSRKSAECKSVLITAKAIDVELHCIDIDSKLKNFDFVKILNPLQTVPILVECDGRSISDSQAIATYLITKYSKDDKFYPKDICKRAIIDQRLHFNSGILLLCCKKLSIFEPKTSFPDRIIKDVNEAYGFLEIFLEDKLWIAGEDVTAADFCMITSVTNLDSYSAVDPLKYPKLTGWIQKAKSLPFYEEVDKALKNLRSQ